MICLVKLRKISYFTKCKSINLGQIQRIKTNYVYFVLCKISITNLKRLQTDHVIYIPAPIHFLREQKAKKNFSVNSLATTICTCSFYVSSKTIFMLETNKVQICLFYKLFLISSDCQRWRSVIIQFFSIIFFVDYFIGQIVLTKSFQIELFDRRSMAEKVLCSQIWKPWN